VCLLNKKIKANIRKMLSGIFQNENPGYLLEGKPLVIHPFI